ncbi:MAG TPA: 6,7-dimethyl-8-ribityllumazine synthase [Chloroflexota bacterium]|nr:6,7-dimethyl-8-ribityllumazine synthase [Chloroflexota bacterium]
MTSFEGTLDGSALRIAVVASRFNELISERLLAGALDGLRRHGVPEQNIDIARVPGSFEIPLVAQQLARTGRYDAVLCVGCVIRGETPHFDLVAGQATTGIAAVALATGVPAIFAVLTTDTVEQALDRAGIKSGNKGYEAALSAIEMANLLRALPKAE